MPGMNAFDVRILGSGIVSRTMALALARAGLRVALQTRPHGGRRPRRTCAPTR